MRAPLGLFALAVLAPSAGALQQGLQAERRPDAPRPVLEGAPLGTTAAPWDAIDHPAAPSALWADPAAPLPTNRWWQNAVLGSGDWPLFTMPYSVKVQAEGLSICRPGLNVQEAFVMQTHLDNLRLRTAEELAERQVVEHDPLSVTIEWRGAGGVGLRTPLVRGMPFVTGLYEQATPLLSTMHAILSLSGQGGSPGTTASGTQHTVELNNGQTWAIYSSASLELTVEAGGVLRASEPLTGWVRVALLPPAGAEVLDASAGRIPLGGRVRGAVAGDTGTLRFEWRTLGDGPLLMMTLPHHRDILSEVTPVDLTWTTLKGPAVGVLGDTWVLTQPMTPIAWTAPRPIDPAREPAVRAALLQDINATVLAPDPYFGGKELAKLGRLALIADELGEDQVALQLRTRLKSELEPWLMGTNGQALAYDRTWGGVLVADAVQDPGSAFGQGYYNDHHFHYGYHVYAAAALAKADPAWAEQFGDTVLHLVRDIANPSDRDPHYPRQRHMDWYAGHSWASGLFLFGDARNQESTSEAVNAWYAVSLWGLATGDARIRDLGRLMLATEIRSAQRYWQVPSTSDVYTEPFKSNKVVGVLWGMKVDYATFFGNAPELIHGIQMLPFTPISEELLDPVWIEEGYPAFSSNLANAGSWANFICMARAVFDPTGAWDMAQTLPSWDNGNTRTNTLYWIATRP